MLKNRVISRFISIIRQSKLPGLLMSSPGTGKTSTVELYAKALNLHVATLIPSQYSFDEILGFQMIDPEDKTHTRRTKPDWYYDMQKHFDEEWILFVDEITTANPYIQGGLLNLIQKRTLGVGMELPPKTTIVAAGNYADNLNNEIQVSAALINRFLILNLDVIPISNEDRQELIYPERYFKKYINPEFTDLNEIKGYLGLNTHSTYPERLQTKLLNEISSSALFYKTDSIQNSSETGMIGYTSERTLVLTSELVKISNKVGYLDEYILKVINDTMGITSKSDSYIYGRLFEIYSEYKGTVNNESVEVDLNKMIDDCGTDPDKWDNLITNILNTRLYEMKDFKSKYYNRMKSIFREVKVPESTTKKFSELAVLMTRSIASDY